MGNMVNLMLGDCLEVMRAMPDNSVDSIVTDPPAGISFMGKDWDSNKGGSKEWISWMSDVAAECLRVIKPGGHALVWAIPRTSHWTGTAWEMAGWVPRDKIYHVFGTGFPKSLNIGKAMDRAAGMEREVTGIVDPRGTFDGRHRSSSAINSNWRSAEGRDDVRDLSKKEITAPATDAAKQWEGWGTALKPAVEEWWLMRKPFTGSVANNVLQWGVGGLNIDGCRVGTEIVEAGWAGRGDCDGYAGGLKGQETGGSSMGRWPANVCHDGSDEVLALFPDSKSGGYPAEGLQRSHVSTYGKPNQTSPQRFTQSEGSAARFFYCAKASKKDREDGIDGFEQIHRANGNKWTDQDYRVSSGDRPPSAESGPRANHHPTVKPTNLMSYLCRLVTPPGGIVLDPFMGSGSTGKAAEIEGFGFVGIERDAEYFAIAKQRIEAAKLPLLAAA